ncbi:MAG: leucine-rich repeat protein [Lepagella sp.]
MRYENMVEVPAKRESDGIPVVGVDGFSYYPYILDVLFEEGSQVKYIGSFKGCTGINTIINFPETVETIADYAFYGCTMLNNLTLSSNLKNIGVSSFEKCTSLQSITLPKSLKVMREYAFRGCTNLETVVFEDEVDFYTNGVYGFYNNVFDGCTKLSSVTLPKNTPGGFIIPMGTFIWCGNLKSIEFPVNTTNIEQMAFFYTGIENLDFTQITSDKFYLQGYYTFGGCKSLKTVTANSNLTFGGSSLYTFQWCESLETVTISGSGDDYTEITPDAFRYCDNLTSVRVYRLKGTGLSNEMDSVFVGCKSLKTVKSDCPPILSKIGVSCFDGCESLEHVDLPVEGTFTISETAFRNCAALHSFDFTNVSSIGTKAFTGCSALTSISIKSPTNAPPAMVNEDAFDESHYNNAEVDVLEERYRDFAADECWSKFKGLKHPSMFAYNPVEGGYSISKGQYALDEDFSDMFVIPEQYESGDVVAIAKDAFKSLTGLTGVTLHEKITSIGSNAFGGCTNIVTVINKATQPPSGDSCPEDTFDSETYLKGSLYVPFGSLDVYSQISPWAKFTNRIKQGLGERTLSAPQASHESGEFNWSFELTLTNPNESGAIYYYIAHDGDDLTAVREVQTYNAPIVIPAENCKVVAYISDGTNCSDATSWEYTYVLPATENGLDRVLTANAGEWYLINTSLYGHYHDGKYLYASTMDNSGSSKNTFNEDKKSEELSDKEADFNQEDWVAISGLSSHFVGKVIGSGYIATVDSNTAYPVISFNEDVLPEERDMGINKFRVENFNIHAESAAVSDIWLVAPQPAEYCSVKGYLKAENIHEAEEYFVLQSAESATTENETVIEPLTMNVYYDPATITLDAEGWYSFTGIVSKDGDALKFTALYKGEVSIANTNAELISMQAGKIYQVNVSLEGVKVNGGVLYARTSGTSAAPSIPEETRTRIESEDGDILDHYDQRDWVAIDGLSSDYVGFEVDPFIAEYDGVTLNPVASTPAVGTAVDVTNLNMFTVANVFYGNYENTETLGLENDYRPFYVKAKVNEVAYYVGLVKLNDDGKYELWGEGEVGKLNDKGLEIDTNGVEITTSTKQIEGVLVADSEANGGVKLVAFAGKNTITGVETPEADGKAAIYGTKGAVVVAGADGKVTIFDAMGRKVKTLDAKGVTTVQMPAGYYIVQTAETAKSVFVM